MEHDPTRLRRHPDGSWLDPDGRAFVCSRSRFEAIIADTDRCFVCGILRTKAEFNDEHVFPKWLLRELDLFDRTVTLPNGTVYRYDRYKVPCCLNCNSGLSAEVEAPASMLLKSGYDKFADQVTEEDAWLVLSWLALLFLKTHYRDNSMRWYVDRRKPETTIGEAYNWSSLHHVHALARAPLVNAEREAVVMGSLAFLHGGPGPEDFDYGDLYDSRSVLVRIRDLAIVANLNDAAVAVRSMTSRSRLPPAEVYSVLQLREVLAEFAWLNLALTPRPEFFSEFSESTGTVRIGSFGPERFGLDDIGQDVRGALMYAACGKIVEKGGTNRPNLVDELRAGQVTFLFDEQGKFRRDSFVAK